MNGWLTEQLRTRAGALATPAETFAEGVLGVALNAFTAPDDAVRALARRMARFVFEQNVDDEADRRFVEGGGALLGLLLLTRTTHGRYVTRAGRGGAAATHLVQLSEHGFYDPFQALDRALSGGDVRRELALHIAEAEAEARGTGPLARTVLALRACLLVERPELTFIGQFATDVTLATPAGERIAVDLAQTVSATRDVSSASVAHSVEKLVRMLPGPAQVGDALEDVRGQLFPRITHRQALDELCERAGAVLLSVPLVGELVAAVVVERAGRARYLKAGEVAAWGITPKIALDLAKENLARASTRTRVLREDTDDGPIFVLRSGDGRDSARVLLRELRDPIEARVGPYVAVTLPHRDVLLACDARVTPLVERLRARTEADAQRAPHRVSSALYVLGEDGLSLLGA